MNNLEKGITLIELIVTIAIIAIIAMFSFQDNNLLQKKNELATLKDQIVSAVHYAKIAALSQNKDVYLANIPSSTNWADGMVLYRKEDNTLLYQWQWKYNNWQVHWIGFNKKNTLVLASNPQHAYSSGHFLIKHKLTEGTERLIVNRLGRIYININ